MVPTGCHRDNSSTDCVHRCTSCYYSDYPQHKGKKGKVRKPSSPMIVCFALFHNKKPNQKSQHQDHHNQPRPKQYCTADHIGGQQLFCPSHSGTTTIVYVLHPPVPKKHPPIQTSSAENSSAFFQPVLRRCTSCFLCPVIERCTSELGRRVVCSKTRRDKTKRDETRLHHTRLID